MNGSKRVCWVRGMNTMRQNRWRNRGSRMGRGPHF